MEQIKKATQNIQATKLNREEPGPTSGVDVSKIQSKRLSDYNY